jgi:hypothetical protein
METRYAALVHARLGRGQRRPHLGAQRAPAQRRRRRQHQSPPPTSESDSNEHGQRRVHPRRSLPRLRIHQAVAAGAGRWLPDHCRRAAARRRPRAKRRSRLGGRGWSRTQPDHLTHARRPAPVCDALLEQLMWRSAPGDSWSASTKNTTPDGPAATAPVHPRYNGSGRRPKLTASTKARPMRTSAPVS